MLKRDKDGLTEEEFLRQYDSNKFPKPSLTADLVIMRCSGAEHEVLLIQRGGHPFMGKWAFPGGFSEMNETIEETAARELMEETCLAVPGMKLLGVYSRPGRDPRGWTVSVAFVVCLNEEEGNQAKAADDAADARWFRIVRDGERMKLSCGDLGLEPDAGGRILAFDHDDILRDAVSFLDDEL